MAAFGPYLNPAISIGGVDLSGKAFNLTWAYEADAIDFSAYGDGTHINKGGLKAWSVECQINAEFSATVDQALFDLVGSSTVAVTWQPSSTAAVGATNPIYSGTAFLQKGPGAEGEVGQKSVFSLSLVSAGPGRCRVAPAPNPRRAHEVRDT